MVQKTGHFLKDQEVKMIVARANAVPSPMTYVLSFLFLSCVCARETTALALTVESSKSYQEALEKYRNKDYPGALAAARRALQEDGNNASYFHIYGLTLAAVQQFKEAEENLQKAIALRPTE